MNQLPPIICPFRFRKSLEDTFYCEQSKEECSEKTSMRCRDWLIAQTDIYFPFEFELRYLKMTPDYNHNEYYFKYKKDRVYLMK